MCRATSQSTRSETGHRKERLTTDGLNRSVSAIEASDTPAFRSAAFRSSQCQSLAGPMS